MREIKFRAWSEANGGMCYDVDIIGGQPRIGATVYLGAKLMQFTGLKDRNGKEIYEGDIARYHPVLDEDARREEDERYQVAYHAPYWMLESKDGAWSNAQGGNAWWAAQVEVVGNIYENPELLTQ
jgi:uncharacterized phage protein (TIGR01671 family)